MDFWALPYILTRILINSINFFINSLIVDFAYRLCCVRLYLYIYHTSLIVAY
jgi:hypothetical protein